jgi:hypothetical protein
MIYVKKPTQIFKPGFCIGCSDDCKNDCTSQCARNKN